LPHAEDDAGVLQRPQNLVVILQWSTVRVFILIIVRGVFDTPHGFFVFYKYNSFFNSGCEMEINEIILHY
jgi:hypothetical protein